MSDISDGASNTDLVGEKYLDPDHYLDGYDPGDDELLFSGYNVDQSRSTWCNEQDLADVKNLSYVPMQDTPGEQNYVCFGSAHPSGYNMGFCDGSVQFMGYSIDMVIHHRLGNRMDGFVIDAGKLK
jgi:prepilin-type processing-associated H-X9-DG protein